MDSLDYELQIEELQKKHLEEYMKEQLKLLKRIYSIVEKEEKKD